MASDAFEACRGTRWLVRSLYFPVFLQIRNLPSPVSRSQAHTHLLVPAARVCARVLYLCFTHPESRVGGAPRNVRVLGEAPVGRIMTRYARRLARRLAPHDAGRSPLGAPPWRFFTRGRASVSGMTRNRAASSSQPGRSAWRATSRASRGKRLQAAAAGRHASLRLQDRL